MRYATLMLEPSINNQSLTGFNFTVFIPFLVSSRLTCTISICTIALHYQKPSTDDFSSTPKKLKLSFVAENTDAEV